MPKARIWGFQCSRCGHEWLPREGVEEPKVCPKCKSPYWDTPRREDIKPENRVECHWRAQELNGKTVEFELKRGKVPLVGVGWLWASDLEDGLMQITIKRVDGAEINLVQSEADSIKTHHGKYRFSCFSRV